MIKIEEIFEKILKNKDKMILYRGVTNECISKYESNNKLYIPDEFKSWLKFSNGGELFVPGTILFGIECDVSPIDQKKTLRYANPSEIRKRMFFIPLSYLVVGKLNFGDFICIDLNNENRVIQWDHENDEEYCYWNSFTEWLLECIDDIEVY